MTTQLAKPLLYLDNYIFDSLELYLEDILSIYKQDRTKLDTFIRSRIVQPYSVFFLANEACASLIEVADAYSDIQVFLQKLLEEGFFVLQAIKHKTAIGRMYQVCYCKNNVRIVNKNLNRLGYLYATATRDLVRVNEHLVLCQKDLLTEINSSMIDANNITDAGGDASTATSKSSKKQSCKRLIELTPRLYLLTNTQADKQIIVLNTNYNAI